MCVCVWSGKEGFSCCCFVSTSISCSFLFSSRYASPAGRQSDCVGTFPHSFFLFFALLFSPLVLLVRVCSIAGIVTQSIEWVHPGRNPVAPKPRYVVSFYSVGLFWLLPFIGLERTPIDPFKTILCCFVPWCCHCPNLSKPHRHLFLNTNTLPCRLVVSACWPNRVARVGWVRHRWNLLPKYRKSVSTG